MGLGAAATQSSPMEDYMRNYGERLQSLLVGGPGYGGGFGGLPIGRGGGPMAPMDAGEGGGSPGPDSALEAAGSPSDLGPDLYRNTGLEQPPGPATAPGQPGPQGPGASPGGGPGAQPGGPGAQPGGGGTSLRDVWHAQSEQVRQQNLDKLQNHLKVAHETIDSAYNTMMKQLGGRPDTDLSKQEKGMLLMEFGMRMMEHSSGRYGFGRDTGAAFGASGVETIQSMRGLQAQKLARQQRYDQMQQQLTIAQGREKTNLAARSALEEGRDIRAFGAQDTSLLKTGMQQEGAGERQESRNVAAGQRTATTEAGKNTRASLARSALSRQFADDKGLMWNVDKSGKVSAATDPKSGEQLKGTPGSSSGRGGKGFASEANYRMYMDTYGKDDQGAPLTGEALQKAQKDALQYASNPHSFALTDAQYRQMAEKSADNYIRSNQLSWAGSSDQEIADKRNAFAEEAFQRMKRNGTAGPNAGANLPNRPKSALAGTGGAGGAAPPTQPPAGGKAASPGALQYLRSNPAQAQAFLTKFGYLPPEFHRYLNPTGVQSALH